MNLGFKPIRQRGTSHLIYKNESKSVVIPNKKGDISIGLLSSIIKQLGSNRNEFLVFNDNSIEKEFNQKKLKKI
ncbi:type II toxin-antitoxin system HicA family toxin [Clostridium perfringens]|nr:type II toxin-antitoxin system HicA family toxin [Clostridium perfringens]